MKPKGQGILTTRDRKLLIAGFRSVVKRLLIFKEQTEIQLETAGGFGGQLFLM